MDRNVSNDAKLLTQLQRAWSRYARQVVDCGDHKAACVRAGGAVPLDDVDPDIRWPGMLGPGYESARYKVLCVGQIHLPTRWKDGLGQLQPLMHEWLKSEVDDGHFIRSYNKKYSTLLPKWGTWKKGFGPVLRRFDIEPEDVVYTNFARCWQASGVRTYEVMNLCARTFPLKVLYDIVRPDAVLALSGASVFAAFPSLMRGIPGEEWHHFPGRRSFAFSDADIDSVATWLSKRLGP